MSDIMTIGISSLVAFKAALSVTSNNIANANTPNFSRRQLIFTSGQFGSGVNTGDAQRIFDDTANQFVQSTGSDVSQMNTYVQLLQNLSPMLNDNTSDVGKYIADTFKALQNLNQDTSSSQQRGLYLDKLSTLVNQFQNVNSEIERQRQNVNQTLQTTVGDMNQLLASIGTLNQLIATSGSTDVADLQDQREGQIEQLAQYMNFSALTDSTGMVNLTLSNGQPLVLAAQAVQISAIPDPSNTTNTILALQNGAITTDISPFITSGSIAGNINFRSQGLDAAQHALGRLSLVFSQSLNAQNKLGIDAQGNFGGDIFTDVNNVNSTGTRVVGNLNNMGTSNMTVTIGNLSQLTTSDYQLSIGAGSTYVLTRSSDKSVVSSGAIGGSFPQSLTVDGFTLNINSGTFNSGDKYLVSPTRNALIDMGVTLTDSSFLALGWPVTVDSTLQQGSSGVIQVTGITDPTSAAFAIPKQLSPPVQIQFLSPTSYQLVDANNLTSVIAGPLTYDPTTINNLFPAAAPSNYDPGYRVSLQGLIKTGDIFNISYNTDSANDNNNGKAISNLYSTGIIQGGSATFGKAYNLLATDIAIKTQSAQASYTSTQSLNNAAQDSRDKISGVSLEEETMNLARYQQAYQASAQILQTARSVFDVIIGLTRS